MKTTMKTQVLLFCCLPFATAATHSLQYFYTATAEVSNFPEFVGVGMVDGVQFVHYDSNSKKTTPKQDWTNKITDPQYWERETGHFLSITQVFKVNIGTAMQRFNQTGGVHVAQQHYGCEWDDVTGATKGFRHDGYDGEDFISMDLEHMRWIAALPQALPTKQKWDNNRAGLENYKQYYTQICVEWLQKYVQYGSDTLGRKISPEVSLLQKGSSSSTVVCHATGFYPEDVMIIWKRDGQEMQEDVDVGETLPNEDGTFQKRAVLTVSPEERKKGQYTCEVAHKSTREPIVKTLTVDDGNFVGIIIGCVVVVALVLIGAIVAAVMIRRNKNYKKAGQSDSDSENSNPIARKGAECGEC